MMVMKMSAQQYVAMVRYCGTLRWYAAIAQILSLPGADVLTC